MLLWSVFLKETNTNEPHKLWLSKDGKNLI